MVILSGASLGLEWPPPHSHALNPVPQEIREHGQTVHAVIVQVLSADGEQGYFPHKFIILRTSTFFIEEVEVFYIRRKLNCKC